mmetsp:Transcript_26505/g.55444  ORF Transcript_26505/g.55444 Transcript_26505/m.55444 type:complete len:382 (-) Transcript_26505:1209-2354(-)
MSGAAANAAARGPLGILLQSSAAQYGILGSGVYYALFPEKVQQALGPYLVGVAPAASNAVTQAALPQIITIQTPAPAASTTSSLTSRSGMVSVVVYASVGAGLCWVGYVVCTTLLPEQIREMMPVTQKVFAQATQTLGRGILNMKKVLEEKILGLARQQDELARSQEETKNAVHDVNANLEQARGDLVQVQSALDRCEDSLETTQDMQGYTLRGIKLLVRCVTTFMPQDGNDPHGYLHDIARFIREGDEQYDRTGGRNASTRRSNHSNNTAVTPYQEPDRTPIARAHAIVPTIHGVPSISSIPEDQLQPQEEILFEPLQTPPPAGQKLERAHSLPSRRPAPDSRRFASSEKAPRPTRHQAVLFGGPDATPEMVDIEALLGH